MWFWHFSAWVNLARTCSYQIQNQENQLLTWHLVIVKVNYYTAGESDGLLDVCTHTVQCEGRGLSGSFQRLDVCQCGRGLSEVCFVRCLHAHTLASVVQQII